MNIDTERWQVGQVNIALDTAMENSHAEESPIDEAIAKGGAVVLELEAAARGVAGYLQETASAHQASEAMLAKAAEPTRLLMTSPVDNIPMDRVEESARKAHQSSVQAVQARDGALSHGGNARQNLERATMYVRKLLNFAESGGSYAVIARNHLQEAHDCAAVLDTKDQPWIGTIDQALSLSVKHVRSLRQNRGHLYDSNNESGDGVDIVGLQEISRRLKEGMVLLQNTKGRPIAKFTEIVKTAGSRVTPDDITYLEALAEAAKRSIKGHQVSIERRKEIVSLATAAQEGSMAYVVSL